MSDVPELQFGLCAEELAIARKALRLPDGAKLSTENYRDWVLIRDTWLAGINSHPGAWEEQHPGAAEPPAVVTKKVISMAKYRR
ncbi:MAG: hypothetical protein WA161_24710 [Pseudomonas sp.]|uniref:hypothetical protein n=1 Tax=Pseudomonas sp. TaxID=306 RepID=UPI003BB4FF81